MTGLASLIEEQTMMSLCVATTSRSSIGRPLSLAIVASESSDRPCDANHLGDSGTMKTRIMMGTMKIAWRSTGIRQPLDPLTEVKPCDLSGQRVEKS